MGMSANIYLDANLDLRELALHLLPEMLTLSEITLENPAPERFMYRFLAEDGRPIVYLTENSRVYYNYQDVSTYRYELSAKGGPQLSYMQALYERLRQHGCFPLAFQKLQGETDFTYQPLDYSPDYSLITRLMPVELLLWPPPKIGKLIRDLKRYTGYDFSGDAFYENRRARVIKGAGGYFEKINPIMRSVTSRYAGTDAFCYLRIFGNDDHPVQRRLKRDTCAREVIAALREKTNIRLEAFEVINCQFVPFA